jgi:hypothetical protein
MPAFGYKNRPVAAEMYIETFDFAANQMGYVGAKIMPLVGVEEQAAEYYKLEAAHLLKKVVDDRVSTEGNFNEVSYTWGYSSYSTQDRGLEYRLTDREKKIHGGDIALEAIGAKMLNSMLAENHERDVITRINALSTTAGSAAWTTLSTNIITDVEAAIARLRAKLMPVQPEKLALVVDWTRWRAMRRNEVILDTFGSNERTDAAAATAARIADILGVGQIIVADAQANSVPTGGTPSYGGLWTATKAALVVVGSGSNDGQDVRWGNTLYWTQGPPRFDRYTKENKTADVIRQRIDRCEHVVCADAIDVISGI